MNRMADLFSALWHARMAQLWSQSSERTGSWGWLRGSIGKRSSLDGPRGHNTKNYGVHTHARENARRRRQIERGMLRVE